MSLHFSFSSQTFVFFVVTSSLCFLHEEKNSSQKTTHARKISLKKARDDFIFPAADGWRVVQDFEKSQLTDFHMALGLSDPEFYCESIHERNSQHNSSGIRSNFFFSLDNETKRIRENI